MAEVFALPKDSNREPVVSRLAKFLLSLPTAKAWRVTVEEQKKTRSDPQNRYLWGVCYPAVLRGGGETLGPLKTCTNTSLASTSAGSPSMASAENASNLSAEAPGLRR
jgi:hypothetical protein